MTTRVGWGLLVVTAVLTGLVLAAVYAGLLVASGGFGGPGTWIAPRPGGFRSNGERIYFTATSASGQPIVAEMGRMVMSSPAACADCHGPDGRGSTVWMMMMGSFEAPDIRYATLVAEGHEEHPAYTDDLIKRAITEGLDPAGEPLKYPMPRWRMSERDLNDLLGYLKSLR
jgi:mono/diheme cytochrome c family protein